MRNIETLPPQDIRAERGVIGSCIRSRDALVECMNMLEQHHFYLPAHGMIWRCLVALMLRNIGIDSLTLAAELRQATWEDKVGGWDYVNQCVDEVPTAANATHYANIILDCWVRREIVRIGDRLVGAAYNAEADINEAIASATSEALNLQMSREDQRALTHVRDVMSDFEERIKKGPLYANFGISTGFPSIDAVVGGYHAGDLQYWGGGPGSGKTTLSMQSAFYVASEDPKRLVAYFSMELGQVKFARRLTSFASQTYGDVMEFDDKRLAAALPEVLRGVRQVAELPFYVSFGRLSTTQIASRLKALMAREGRRPTVVFIDRIELLSDTDCAAMEETKRIPILSPRVKGIATALEVPVVCLVQLNRAGRDGKPTMEAFRASGSIEQDCQVGFIIRSEKPHQATAGTAVVHVVKNNDGETGETDPPMRWEPRYPKFTDLTPRKP